MEVSAIKVSVEKEFPLDISEMGEPDSGDEKQIFFREEDNYGCKWRRFKGAKKLREEAQETAKGLVFYCVRQN